MTPPDETGSRIRTLIVDDEPLARSNLRVLLSRDPEIDLIGESASGIEAITAIRDHQPDLVFLDVQMPECDGFDVLEAIGSALPSAVIFVTAYDEYALRAFDAGVLDYLVKPFNDDRFARMLARAKQRVSGSRVPPAPVARLAVKNAGCVMFVSIEEIDWIEAADYYACLHVGKKSHLLRRSLAELEQELDCSTFCRVHRSSIVNLSRVRALHFAEDGECCVLLKDGAKLPLSRRYRKQLESRLAAATG